MSGTHELSRFAKPAKRHLEFSVVQLRLARRCHPAFRYIVTFGAAALLAGCVGEPRTYYAAKPIVVQKTAVPRVSRKSAPAPSAPTSTTALSVHEKQKLFEAFQASQGLKDPMVTTPGAAP